MDQRTPFQTKYIYIYIPLQLSIVILEEPGQNVCQTLWDENGPAFGDFGDFARSVCAYVWEI